MNKVEQRKAIQKTVHDARQGPRVFHCKEAHYDVYVGRGSKWGNPFSHKPSPRIYGKYLARSREEAIEKYAEWIRTQRHLMAALPELKGKVLGCWCKPKPCHGDILLALANKEEKEA